MRLLGPLPSGGPSREPTPAYSSFCRRRVPGSGPSSILLAGRWAFFLRCHFCICCCLCCSLLAHPVVP